MEVSKNRISHITWMQFVGFILVVLGHCVNGLDVPNVFIQIMRWIYAFHMPLFFFISAHLFSYKGGYDMGKQKVLKRRFIRLIIPYIIWNCLFILPKAFFVHGASDDIVFSWEYFIHMLFYPRSAVLGHTWFLFALFEMYILAILLDKLRRYRALWFPVTALLVIANCFGVAHNFLSVGDIMKNAVIFWLGLLAGSIDIEKTKAFCKDKVLAIAVFILLLITTVFFFLFDGMRINILFLAMSAIFLIMIIGVMFKFDWNFIDFVSKNSFPMYILHWPAMMVVRALLYHKLGLPGIPVMIAMFIGGIVIPAAIVFVIKKINVKWMRKIIGVVFGI